MERYASIDIMRTIAIVMMVMCHFVIYTSDLYQNPAIFFFGDQIMGDTPAALFTFLVGMSFAISNHKYAARGIEDKQIMWRGLIRGAVIFVFGLIFGAVVWGMGDVFDWDILTLLGTCILLLTFLRNTKPNIIIVLGIVIVVLAPLLREYFDYPRFWEIGDDYAPPMTLAEILGGYLLNGYFPVFPWIAFSFFGFAIGKTIILQPADSCKAYYHKWLLYMAVAGIFISIGSFLWSTYGNTIEYINLYFSNLTFYPFSNSMFLLQISLIFILFYFLYAYVDQRQPAVKLHSFFSLYGRYALSVYVIHHLLLVAMPRLIGYLLYEDDYYFYQDFLTPTQGLIASVIFIFLFYFVIRLWDKVGGKYSFEWFITHAVPQFTKK